MSLARTLVRNIASNWIGYGVQVIVTFFLTPYVLHALGQTGYGIWTLAMTLTGYYGLLDFGVGVGMSQYLTRYLAVKDFDGLKRTASTGFVVLTCFGLVVFVGSVAIALNASALFKIPADLIADTGLVIVITGASVALQFVFLTYSAAFTVVQRFDLSNGIGIATRLLSATATVLCLNLGYGLVALSLVVAGTNLIDYLLRCYVASQILPQMRISFKSVSRSNFGEILSYGFWGFVIAASVRLISYTDSLVIAAFMPIAAVAPFAVAASLRSYFEDIFVRVGFVFYPAVTELDAKGDQTGLTNLYLISSKFMFLGSILCGSVAICWASDFFRLWIGSGNAQPAGYPSVATLFTLLMLGSMLGVAQRIGHQVLQGIRQVRLLANLFAIEGLTNLLLSILLVRDYGLLGVGLGSVIPAVVIQGFCQPLFVCRSLRISLNTYCRHVLLRPTAVLMLLVPLLVSFAYLTPVDDWPSLALWGSLSGILALLSVVLVGLSKSERDLMVVRPITMGLAKFRAVILT